MLDGQNIGRFCQLSKLKFVDYQFAEWTITPRIIDITMIQCVTCAFQKPTDKKPRNGNQTLEEIKRRGRQLRSAHKDGGLLGLYGGLTLEDFADQPQE